MGRILVAVVVFVVLAASVVHAASGLGAVNQAPAKKKGHHPPVNGRVVGHHVKSQRVKGHHPPKNGRAVGHHKKSHPATQPPTPTTKKGHHTPKPGSKSVGHHPPGVGHHASSSSTGGGVPSSKPAPFPGPPSTPPLSIAPKPFIPPPSLAPELAPELTPATVPGGVPATVPKVPCRPYKAPMPGLIATPPLEGSPVDNPGMWSPSPPLGGDTFPIQTPEGGTSTRPPLGDLPAVLPFPSSSRIAFPPQFGAAPPVSRIEALDSSVPLFVAEDESSSSSGGGGGSGQGSSRFVVGAPISGTGFIRGTFPPPAPGPFINKGPKGPEVRPVVHPRPHINIPPTPEFSLGPASYEYHPCAPEDGGGAGGVGEGGSGGSPKIPGVGVTVPAPM